jgi:hypothetical protein
LFPSVCLSMFHSFFSVFRHFILFFIFHSSLFFLHIIPPFNLSWFHSVVSWLSSLSFFFL